MGNTKNWHIFINMRTGKRLTRRHFEKLIDKWTRLLNIQKTSVHQAQRQGVSSDHVNGIAGGGGGHHDLQWR
ncbi:MAG: hypothetical protein P1P80_09090 [ANME-2 cluster archaeon]|nr:hypothetical protein [ANME-2 cluster archaeon]